MRRLVIVVVGLGAVMLVLAAYLGFSHSVRAWFAEPAQQPTGAAQERTLTTKHVEISLPAELALGDVQPMVGLPYIDDFEGPWPGPWLIDGNWGQVACNSHSPTHSASASGDPTCATYYNDQYSWMVYGPFDLSGASAGGVQFWFDLDTENGYDYLYAAVSTDEANFCGYGLSGYSAGWMNNYPPFAPWDFAYAECPVLGYPQVWFAFIFVSDDIVPYPGAWVDDVCIWRDDPSVCGGGGGEADVKVVDQYIYPIDAPDPDGDGIPNINVSQDYGVMVDKVVHNNGPLPVETQLNWSVTAPPGCEFIPYNPGPAQVPLDVSITQVIFEDGTIHCWEPGEHTFWWDNCLSIKDPGITDPDPSNDCASTPLTVEAEGGGEPSTVRIGSGSAPTCTEDSVPLEILAAPGVAVGAATVDIVYNPAVAEPTAWAGGPAYDMVQCSLAYAPNTVRCTAISAAGVPGQSLVADLTFHCIGETGECTPLDVQVDTLADPSGNPLPWIDQDGEFCCGGCGDVNCDSQIDAVDALFVLQYVVGLRAGSDQCPPPAGALYLPAADVNCDAMVDAVDALFILQYVVGLRAELCVC